MARVKLKRKKILVGAVSCFLLMLVGVTIWVGLLSNEDDDQVIAPQSIEDIQIEAAQRLDSGDSGGGLTYYDEMVELEQQDDKKQLLLVNKSSFALMAKEYVVAIEAAKQADELGSNAVTTRALAEAHAASGNKEQAIVYYRKLIELTPEDEGGRRGPSIESIIKGLEE